MPERRQFYKDVRRCIPDGMVDPLLVAEALRRSIDNLIEAELLIDDIGLALLKLVELHPEFEGVVEAARELHNNRSKASRMLLSGVFGVAEGEALAEAIAWVDRMKSYELLEEDGERT